MAPHIPDEDFVEYLTRRALWLRRVAYLLCQDWNPADDLAQSAMTRLYAQWPRARSFDNLDGYLRRILHTDPRSAPTAQVNQRSPSGTPTGPMPDPSG
jgi:Sigma-70 region 2